MDMYSDMNENQSEMISLIKKLAPSQGYTQSILENITFMRVDQALESMQTLYEPSIVIVLQGEKHGYYLREKYTYDAQNYLVVSVPLPFSVETIASSEQPLLGLILRIDPLILAELVVDLSDYSETLSGQSISALYASPMDTCLENSVYRLIKALSEEREAKILAPSIYREILYRVLVNEQGQVLRSTLYQNNSFGKISKVLHYIHNQYQTKIDLDYLASQANLSIPSLHVHFKAVTSTSPIQYIKMIRLHKSRLMMIQENTTVEDAARRVGYESTSQFSREFKRLFGQSPMDEVKKMKSIFTLSPSS